MARVRRSRDTTPGSTAHSISCTDEEHDRIRKRAAAADRSFSAYAVARALTVNLPGVATDADVAPRLVLDAPAQRELHAWMERAAKHVECWSEGLVERVELVWRATMLEMLARGRREEMYGLLEEVLGEARGREAGEGFEREAEARDWLP